MDREKLSKILQVNYAKGVTPQTSEDTGESKLRKKLKRKKRKKDKFEDDPLTPPTQTGGASY